MTASALRSLCLLCALWACAAAHAASPQVEAILARLDSVLAAHDELVEKKEMRIDHMRHAFNSAPSDAERLAMSRRLYDEYTVYDSDSALLYALTTIRLMERTAPGDYDDLAAWRLNEAFIYTVQGRFEDALAVLNAIDTSRLSAEVRARYFYTASYAHSMYSMYLHDNHEQWRDHLAKANAYRDSICTPGLPRSEEWMWVPLSMATDKEHKDISGLDVSAIRQSVDNATEPTRLNAINSYWLARYYEVAEEPDSLIYYMARAAIFDAQIVNREIAALHELATHLFDRGDLNRAYNYLLYDVRQANLYHNRYRIVALSNILPEVRDAYRAEIEKRDRRLSAFVWVLAALSIVLAVMILVIVIEFRRLRNTRNLLKIANDELSASIAQRDKAIDSLEQSNASLSDANKQKLGILAYTFKLTTQYINALEDYRKKLLKRYRARQIDELGVLLNNPDLIKEQYQEFYESFDRMVLSIFPDFVEEYNAAAAAPDRVSAAAIARTRTLNTRLRIHALRRLGVTKSADIAAMLNVSIRTVYNNRSNAAGTPEEPEN